jgi:hypothetical protein
MGSNIKYDKVIIRNIGTLNHQTLKYRDVNRKNSQSTLIAVLYNIISVEPVSETNVSQQVKNVTYLQISSTV